jgi:hypothetical protein
VLEDGLLASRYRPVGIPLLHFCNLPALVVHSLSHLANSRSPKASEGCL